MLSLTNLHMDAWTPGLENINDRKPTAAAKPGDKLPSSK